MAQDMYSDWTESCEFLKHGLQVMDDHISDRPRASNTQLFDSLLFEQKKTRLSAQLASRPPKPLEHPLIAVGRPCPHGSKALGPPQMRNAGHADHHDHIIPFEATTVTNYLMIFSTDLMNFILGRGKCASTRTRCFLRSVHTHQIT